MVALALFLIAGVGAAVLAGGIALVLAKLGVSVDAWVGRKKRRGPNASDDNHAVG